MLEIKEIKLCSGTEGQFIVDKVYSPLNTWVRIKTQTNRINYPGPKLNTYGGGYREILTSGGIIQAIFGGGKVLMEEEFTSGGVVEGHVQTGFDMVGKVDLKPLDSVILEWQDGYIKLVSMPTIAIATLATVW